LWTQETGTKLLVVIPFSERMSCNGTAFQAKAAWTLDMQEPAPGKDAFGGLGNGAVQSLPGLRPDGGVFPS